MIYKSEKPNDLIMRAIVDLNYFVYSRPLYEHYNWCLDYLNSAKQRVENPAVILSGEDIGDVQYIMIEACSRYIGENRNG